MTKITVTDYTGYQPETCNTGGNYSFTTEYQEVAVNKWQVWYYTSAELGYCHFCGSFLDSQGNCTCGMEEPETIDSEALDKRLDAAGANNFAVIEVNVVEIPRAYNKDTLQEVKEMYHEEQEHCIALLIHRTEAVIKINHNNLDWIYQGGLLSCLDKLADNIEKILK